MFLYFAQDDHPTTCESKTKIKSDNFYRIRGNSSDCDIWIDVSIRKAQNFSDLYEKLIWTRLHYLGFQNEIGNGNQNNMTTRQ
jgi:hypothetical protein